MSAPEDLAAAAVLRGARPDFQPRLGLVLGSGLGEVAAAIEDAADIPYADLPGFPQPSVAGHGGSVRLGRLAGTATACLLGRAHYYEGRGPAAMKVPIRTLRRLGCTALLLTNAAGSLDPKVGPGSLMAICDHINFAGTNPLIGETDGADDDGAATRFVNLTDAYDPALRRDLQAAATRIGLTLREGVYIWFSGPSFETPAEIRAARVLGADAVGMSTVPEVILARHCGLRVAAISILVNLAAGLADQDLSHQRTIAEAGAAADSLRRLLLAFAERFDAGR